MKTPKICSMQSLAMDVYLNPRCEASSGAFRGQNSVFTYISSPCFNSQLQHFILLTKMGASSTYHGARYYRQFVRFTQRRIGRQLLHYETDDLLGVRLVHAGVSFLLPLSNPFPKLLNSEADISPNIRPAPKIQSTNAIDSLLWRTKVQERPRSRPRTNKVVAHVLSCHYTGITSACDALLSSAQNDGKRRLVADKRPSSGHQCGDCGHEHYNRISCAKCRRDEDTGDYIC